MQKCSGRHHQPGWHLQGEDKVWRRVKQGGCGDSIESLDAVIFIYFIQDDTWHVFFIVLVMLSSRPGFLTPWPSSVLTPAPALTELCPPAPGGSGRRGRAAPSSWTTGRHLTPAQTRGCQVKLWKHSSSSSYLSESFVGSDGELNEEKITETIGILNTINNRLENPFHDSHNCEYLINLVQHWRMILEAVWRRHQDLIWQLYKSGIVP